MNQLGGKQGVELYSGVINAFVTIFKNEGIGAFYKGFVPLYFRLSPWNVAFFMSFEFYKSKLLPQFSH